MKIKLTMPARITPNAARMVIRFPKDKDPKNPEIEDERRKSDSLDQPLSLKL